MENLSLSALRRLNEELTLNLAPAAAPKEIQAVNLVSPSCSRSGLKILASKNKDLNDDESEEAVQGLIKEFLLAVETTRLAMMYSDLKSKHHNLIEQTEEVSLEVRNFLRQNTAPVPQPTPAYLARTSLPVLQNSNFFDKRDPKQETLDFFPHEDPFRASPGPSQGQTPSAYLDPIEEHTNPKSDQNLNSQEHQNQPHRILHQSGMSGVTPPRTENPEDAKTPMSVTSFQRQSGVLRASTVPLVLESPVSGNNTEELGVPVMSGGSKLSADDIICNLDIGASLIQLKFAGILFLLSTETERLRYCLQQQDSEYAVLTQELEERNVGLALQNQELEELVFRMDARVRTAEEELVSAKKAVELAQKENKETDLRKEELEVSLTAQAVSGVRWVPPLRKIKFREEKESSTTMSNTDIEMQEALVESLTDEANSLQLKIIQLNDEISKHQSKDAELLRESLSVDSLSNQVMRVQELLEEKNKELEATNEELMKTLGEFEAFRAQATKEKLNASKLETQMEELDLLSHRLKEELSSEQQKNKKILTELSSEKQKREAVEAVVTDLSKRRSLQMATLPVLTLDSRENEPVDTSPVRTEDDEITKLKHELESNKQIVQNLQEDMERIKAEVAQAAIDEIENMQQVTVKQLEDKDQMIESLSQEITIQRDVIGQLKAKLEVEKFEKGVDPIEEIPKQLEVAKVLAESPVGIQNEQIDEELQKLKEDLEQSNKDLRSAAAESFRKDKEINEKNSEIKSLAEKLRLLQLDNDTLLSTSAKTSTDLSSLAQTHTALLSTLTSQTAELAAQQHQITGLEQRTTTLQEALESAAYETEVYKAAADQHEADGERLAKDLESARLQVSRLEDRVKVLEDEKGAAERVVGRGEEERRRVGEEERRRGEEAVKACEERMAAVEREREGLAREVGERGRVIGRLESEVGRLQQEVAGLEEKLRMKVKQEKEAVVDLGCQTPVKIKHVTSEDLGSEQIVQASPDFYRSVRKLVPTPGFEPLAVPGKVMFLEPINTDTYPERTVTEQNPILNYSQLGDSILQSYLPQKLTPKPELPILQSLPKKLELPSISDKEKQILAKKIEDYTMKLSRANSLFPALPKDVPGYASISTLESALSEQAGKAERYRVQLQRATTSNEHFRAESGGRQAAEPPEKNESPTDLGAFFEQLYTNERSAREQADKRSALEFRRRQLLEDMYADLVQSAREQGKHFEETTQLLLTELNELRGLNTGSETGQVTRLAGSTRSGGSHYLPGTRRLENSPLGDSQVVDRSDPIQSFGYSSLAPIFGVASTVKNRSSMQTPKSEQATQPTFLQLSTGLKNFSLKKVATHVEAVGTGRTLITDPRELKEASKKAGMTFGSLENTN